MDLFIIQACYENVINKFKKKSQSPLFKLFCRIQENSNQLHVHKTITLRPL